MADFYTNYPAAQKPMTLGEMLNMAGGVQQYQQAQQMNPLALQKAQMEIEQAKQMNPLAVQKSTEEVSQQKTKTLQDAMVFEKNVAHEISSSQVALINNPLVISAEKNPNNLSQKDKQKLAELLTRDGMNTAKALNIPEDKATLLIKQFTDRAEQDPGGLRQFLKQRHIQTLDAASKTTALNPSGTAVDYGTGGQTTSTSEFSAVPPGQAIPGTQFNKGLPPQLATSETGLPVQYGGGGAPGIVNPPQQKNIQPVSNVARPPVVNNQSVGNQVAPPVNNVAQNLNQQFGAKGGIQISPGETVEAYKARVADLSQKPKLANNALSLANRDSVVNQEYNNNQVLNLLDKKDLDIGPLANAIANKTGGIGLSDDQQKIVKYLEQRIRMESARSNQDESSQRNAFGSFKNSKESLREIIYNDKGLLASQRLYNQGLLKAQGNPNKPNLSAINDFENKFNLLNQDPNLPHLLGVMGNKKMEQLTDSERIHLNKYFSKMSDDEIKKLFSDRDALLNLVSGGR